MLGWMLLMAVTVSHALCFVDITGKAAVIPVCSTAACGSRFACTETLSLRVGVCVSALQQNLGCLQDIAYVSRESSHIEQVS